jgi:hypothetical protein
MVSPAYFHRLAAQMKHCFTVHTRYLEGSVRSTLMEGRGHNMLGAGLREGEEPVKSVSGHDQFLNSRLSW